MRLRKSDVTVIKVWEVENRSRSVNIGSSPQEVRELLSCSTCVFLKKYVTEENQGWCNAHDAPNIIRNYCDTFKGLGGKV